MLQAVKFALSILLLISAVSCRRQSVVTSVAFSLPKKFTGIISITASPHGQRLDDQFEVIVVPRSGKVLVASLKPFQDGLSESFHYTDGTLLEYDNTDPHSSDIQVFALGMGTYGTGAEDQVAIDKRTTISYYVGRYREYIRSRIPKDSY